MNGLVVLKILTALSFVSLRGFCTWRMIADRGILLLMIMVSVYLGEFQVYFAKTWFRL